MEINILKEIANFIPGVIFFAKSRDGKFIYACREYERLFKVKRDWLIGKTCQDLMPDHLADICCSHDNLVLSKGTPQKFDEQYLINGEERIFSSIKIPLRHESGAIYGVAGISIDVTESKQKEAALTEANARLEALVNAIPDIVVLRDADGRYLLVNRAAARFMGMSREEAAGKTNGEVLSPDTATMCRASDEKALAARDPVHAEESLVTGTGETIHLDTIKTAIRDDQGEITGLVTVSRNMTERKQAEEALRESRERFRDLIEASSDWIWEVDNQCVYTYVSPQVQEILGYRPEEVLGKTPFSFMSPEEAERVARSYQKIIASRQPFYLLESVNLHRNGNRVILETSGVPFFDDSGQLKGYRGIDRDISERKRIEEELQKAQKLESIGLLAGGIAHDFNNILTAIQGNIELARMFLPPGDRAGARLAVAEQASVRARGLAQQLLTFARGGAPIAKTTAVAHLAREAVEFALRGSRVKGECRFAEDLRMVEADESQLNQAVNNLALNAVEAMPDGGFLTVTADNESLPPGNPLGLPPGEYIRIAFKDQGVGIPAELQGRIFDPYFTTKEKGSGLGLAISFSIVKRHGGTITVESAAGQGSTFAVFLPASRQGAAVSAPAEEKEEIKTGSGRILVMDDEEDVSEVAAEMLRFLGYQVKTVKDGSETVSAYGQAMEEGEPFAAVIVDLTVPAAMGGKETVRRLLDLDPQAKVIVSSGYANDPIMSEYVDYGFKGVIPKPYRLNEFGKVLREVIGRGEAG